MRVVVITPTGRHHRHFAAALAEDHDVVGVIHPGSAAPTRGVTEKLRRELSARGPAHAVLRSLAELNTPLQGWDPKRAHAAAEQRFFPNGAAAYDRFVEPIAHTVANVNSPEGIAVVRDLQPDVVLCLGGPIYRRPLIEACPLMINFHSGVSPIYNGASTIMFAFANGHLRLCGGTLMTMSPEVDGGDILAHYLPAIAPGDDPATLFMKTIGGAIEASRGFLRHLEEHGRFTSCPQPDALFSCRSADWTLHHTRSVRAVLDRDAASSNARPAELRSYWGAADDEDARRRVAKTLSELLSIP